MNKLAIIAAVVVVTLIVVAAVTGIIIGIVIVSQEAEDGILGETLTTSNNVKDMEGYSDVDGYISLSDEDIQDLEDLNFAFIEDPNRNYDLFEDAYSNLDGNDVPILVTSDSVLHTYHIFFGDTLRKIEEEYLFGDVLGLTQALLSKAWDRYNKTADNISTQEICRKELGFFSVAMALLDPTFEPNASVAEDVEAELALIEAHAGIKPSPMFSPYDPSDVFTIWDEAGQNPQGMTEDYSQYIPRGHYTHSETLKRYFKAMMWYGRIPFQFGNAEMSRIGILICHDLANEFHNGELLRVILPEDGSYAHRQGNDLNWTQEFNGRAHLLWDRIYNITEKFVGEADDITWRELVPVVSEHYGSTIDYSLLMDEDIMVDFKKDASTLRKPTILSGLHKTDWGDFENTTHGFRFMGQRYIPDSEMFTNLVYGNVGLYEGTRDPQPFTCGYVPNAGDCRVFPRGLDVFAVFGSDISKKVIVEEGDDEFSGYYDNREDLEEQFSNLTDDDWSANMYMGWLYSIKDLSDPVIEEQYPQFMRSENWSRVKLNTQLASWASLRHDTILYAKQSYTEASDSCGEPGDPPPPPPIIKGYVEPTIELYERLSSLTVLTKDLLNGQNALSSEREQELTSFVNVLNKLKTLSEKELNGEELTEAEYKWIQNFGGSLSSLTGNAEPKGKKTTIIADVHTDVNSGQVLEEGLGTIDYVVVAVQRPDGSWSLCIGPAYSYYEFKHPMSDRLTDEKWREMLSGANPPEQVLFL